MIKTVFVQEVWRFAGSTTGRTLLRNNIGKVVHTSVPVSHQAWFGTSRLWQRCGLAFITMGQCHLSASPASVARAREWMSTSLEHHTAVRGRHWLRFTYHRYHLPQKGGVLRFTYCNQSQSHGVFIEPFVTLAPFQPSTVCAATTQGRTNVPPLRYNHWQQLYSPTSSTSHDDNKTWSVCYATGCWPRRAVFSQLAWLQSVSRLYFSVSSSRVVISISPLISALRADHAPQFSQSRSSLTLHLPFGAC